MRLKLRGVVQIGATILLAASVMGQEGKEPQLLKDIEKLQKKIGIITAFDALGFNKFQLQTIYDCAKKAQALKRRRTEEFKQLAKEQIKIFAAFKQEDLENKGFKPETEKKTAIADHRGQELMKKFYQEINKLEEEVKNILTANQLELIESSKSLRQLATTKLKGKHPVNAKDELMSKSKPKDAKANILEELEEQRKYKYGGIGNIGKLLVYDDTLEIVAKRLEIKSGKGG